MEKLQEKNKEYQKLKTSFQKKERAVEKSKEKVWKEEDVSVFVLSLIHLYSLINTHTLRYR